MLLAKKSSQKLSVRQTESLVESLNQILKIQLKKRPYYQSLEEELTNKIGMRVFVKNKRNNSGTISLEYKDLIN